MLDSLAVIDPDSSRIPSKLWEIASLALCRAYHQRQVEDVVNQWQQSISFMSCPPSPRLSDLDVDQKLRLLRKLVAQLEEEWDEEDREMEKERIRRKKKAKRQREAREQEAARKQKQARKQKEARKAEETEEETDEDTEEETDEETGEEQERQAQQQAKKEANEWSSTWSMYLEEWKDLKGECPSSSYHLPRTNSFL